MARTMKNNQDNLVLSGQKSQYFLSEFSSRTTKLMQTNLTSIFGAKIRDLEKTLLAWQKRKLTLYGKINIVKTLGLSKLIFNASVLHIPDHFIEENNKITFNFI